MKITLNNVRHFCYKPCHEHNFSQVGIQRHQWILQIKRIFHSVKIQKYINFAIQKEIQRFGGEQATQKFVILGIIVG